MGGEREGMGRGRAGGGSMYICLFVSVYLCARFYKVMMGDVSLCARLIDDGDVDVRLMLPQLLFPILNPQRMKE